MTKEKIQIVDDHDSHLGYVHISGRLPAFLMIDGQLYQRYGMVRNYRYVLETGVYIPEENEVTMD